MCQDIIQTIIVAIFINVQAMCDSECRLLFYALAAPGKPSEMD